MRTFGRFCTVGHMDTAIGYARRSTGRQDLSFSAQRATVDRIAPVVAWFTDTCSGSTPPHERPGFVAALAAIREHGATVLVTAKRDRIARDVVHAAMADAAVERLGARIVSEDAPQGDANPYARAMRQMLDVFSELERQVIRHRTRAALQAKRAKGEPLGRAPYGWRHEEGALVPVEAEQATLDRMGQLRATGATWAAVAAELNREGMGGRHWHRSTARRVFLREVS